MNPPKAVSDKPSPRMTVPRSLKWRGEVSAGLIYGLVRFIAGTLRYEVSDLSGQVLPRLGGPFIFCVWHNRLALSLIIYNKYIRQRDRNRRMAAMVSASGDGALVARILEHFGVQPVRGSSSRRGAQALLELTGLGERGHDLSITPDGPRGPVYCVQDGIIALAQLTGLPILPISYHLSRKFRLNSWDQFQVPLPLSRCRITVGPTLRAPREMTDEQRETLRRELENRMRAITRD